MKRTGRKHLLRSIVKGGVSYLAVAIIAGVSIANYHGFQSSAYAILDRANAYFNENNLETFEVSCANGITLDDLGAIAGWEGVETVEGGYTSSVVYRDGDEGTLVQARSLTESVNVPVVVEGELPDAADEVAVEELMAEELGVGVGDVITLEQDGCLVGDTFTVTAVINTPNYVCGVVEDARGTGEAGLGSNEYYVGLSQEAFDPDYFDDCYTTAYVDSSVLDGVYYFSDEYEAGEADYLARIEPLAQERAELRYESVRDEADQKISDAEAEVADGRSELESQRGALDDARVALEGQLAALGLPTDFDEAKDRLASLGAAGAALSSAIDEYDSSAAELADAEVELADAETELADAKAEVADLQQRDWVVSGRGNVGDIRSVRLFADCIFGLSVVMALMFMLVAVIVCFAAITRVIREQRVLLGAQKALGFTPGEILRHYALYNLSCAVIGVLVGWFLGIFVVELMSLSIFAPKFLFDGVTLLFSWPAALLSAAACVAVFLVATFVTCTSLVREPAIDLMRGEALQAGKRTLLDKMGVTRGLRLYDRTLIKNALNDKGRLATSVIGVMGCTALLVACFTMKLGIIDSSTREFEDYTLYDYRLSVDTEKGSTDDFAAVLDDGDASYALVQDKLMNIRYDGSDWEATHVVAASDSSDLDGFVVLSDMNTGEELEVPTDGVLVSRKIAENLSLSAGDTIELMDANGGTHEATVSGVIEHYAPYHLIVTSDAYYEQVMGEEPDHSVFYVEGDVSGVADDLASTAGYLSLKDNSAYERDGSELDLVIFVCTTLSAVMSVLVLMNQIIMYIDKKARELAVMRINGYTLQQTKAYVYLDNVVLIVLGLIAGCVFGVGLAYVDVRVIEAGAEHFVRDPNLLACLLAVVIIAVFALAVNLFALRKINHLNLTNVSSN